MTSKLSVNIVYFFLLISFYYTAFSVQDKVSAFLYICLNSSEEVSKEVLKIEHPFLKSSLKDLLKFFQRHFPKKFRKFAYFLRKKKSSKDLPKKFRKFGPAY